MVLHQASPAAQCVTLTAAAVMLLLQGWLGRNDTVLHQGEGPIRAVAWHGPIMVWASDVGVKVRRSVRSMWSIYGVSVCEPSAVSCVQCSNPPLHSGFVTWAAWQLYQHSR